MPNPFSGIISTEFKTLFTNAIDALLEDSALTRTCRFVYSGSKATKCPNCQFNSVTGKSNNIYISGGPIPFYHGICPFCNGEGLTRSETTTTFNLAILWDYRKWLPVAQPIKSPEGVIQTICRFNLIDEIKKAKELIVDTNIEEYVRHRFIREGEPNPIGFGASDYILTFWRRAG